MRKRRPVARPKTPCPGCTTPQPFPLRRRMIPNSDVIQIYISCTVCPWKDDVRQSTAKLEELYDRRSRLQAAKMYQVERYGTMTEATRRHLQNIGNEIEKEKARAGV